MSTLVTKITLKKVVGSIDVEKLIAAKGKQIELMDVYGFARKSVPESSSLGEYVKFMGRFKAANLETGEVFESGGLILPRVAQDALAGAFGDNTDNVQFGFRISVKYDPTVPVKYAYQCVPLMQPAENDPLILLENQIKADFQKLSAPKKVA